MDVKVVSEKANPLLGRKEYVFEVAHPEGPTPKREDVRKLLSEVLKVPKDRLILEHMRARFGTQRTRGLVHAYDSKDMVAKVVREHILIRNGLKEKPQKGPAGAAPAAEAKPAGKPAEKAVAKPAAAPAKAEEKEKPAAKPAEKAPEKEKGGAKKE
jgi:small subunit ribosomal protein S24e